MQAIVVQSSSVDVSSIQSDSICLTSLIFKKKKSNTNQEDDILSCQKIQYMQNVLMHILCVTKSSDGDIIFKALS